MANELPGALAPRGAGSPSDVVVVEPAGGGSVLQTTALALVEGALGFAPTAAVVNEWPDPQFCVQDADLIDPGINDACTGELGALSVSGYTLNAQTVVAACANTAGLLVGSMVQFSTPADGALLKNILRVTAINPNVSFTVALDYTSGVPTVSAPCSVTIVQKGDITGAAGGQITSQVQKSVPATKVWISDRPAHTSLLKGCKRVLVVQKATSGGEIIYWAASADRLGAIAGTSRAVGAAVCVLSGGVTASAYASINDGAYSYGAGGATAPTRTWISCQRNVTAGAGLYQAGISLFGPVGATFVIGEFTEAASPGPLPDGSFSTPRAQFIRFIASVSPWNNTVLTAPASGYFAVDAQQWSAGVFNTGVSLVCGLLDGSAPAGSYLTSRTAPGAPCLYNPVLAAYSTATYAYASGNFNFSEGQPYFYWYGSASSVWNPLEFDLHCAILFAGP